MNNFLALIRYAINENAPLPEPLNEKEWQEVWKISMKQAVPGIVFHAIEKLPLERKPSRDILMSWISISMKIRKMNELLYRRTAQTKKNFEKCGFRNCILKGQGNALMYPDPYIRTPGDIDVWLDGKRRDIIKYVRGIFPKVKFKYQHIEFPAFKDAQIEVHYMPMYTQNPITNIKLQKFFRKEKEKQIGNIVLLPDNLGEISMPLPYFNAVYQITHIFIHFIIEGIGLRQFIDYYYVLKNLPEEDREYVVKMLKEINMYKFTQAVMYVEKNLLGLDKKYIFIPIDEENGRILAKEIFFSGNFGQHETRFWKKGGGFVDKQWQKIKRNSRFLLTYPSEEICEPFFRAYHFLWRCYYKYILKI